MSNLAKLADEELQSALQDVMAKRSAAEEKFREQQLEIQFEIDKRFYKAQLGGASSPAQLAAIAELQAEAANRAAESEDES